MLYIRSRSCTFISISGSARVEHSRDFPARSKWLGRVHAWSHFQRGHLRNLPSVAPLSLHATRKRLYHYKQKVLRFACPSTRPMCRCPSRRFRRHFRVHIGWRCQIRARYHRPTYRAICQVGSGKYNFDLVTTVYKYVSQFSVRFSESDQNILP